MGEWCPCSKAAMRSPRWPDASRPTCACWPGSGRGLAMPDTRHYLTPLFEPTAACVVSESDPGRDPWFAALVEGLRTAFGEIAVHRLPAHAQYPAPATGPLPAPATATATEDAATPAGQRAGRLAGIRVDDPARVGEAIALAADQGADAAVALEGRCDAAQRRRWRELARARGLRLLGPATLGFIRPAVGL